MKRSRIARLTLSTIALLLQALVAVEAQSPKLVKSSAGPSGQVTGSSFAFDEVRNRFVYPQDRSLTVYFEWEIPAGNHVLTASWKQPDGRVVSVSPDVKMQTTTDALNCYWIFNIASSNQPGTWTVEVRIDGQPAGSHAFELAGVEGGRRTLDQVFKSHAPGVVRIHKLDASGRRLDLGTGFVAAKGVVATAFQVIDSAAKIEVEFADGRREETTQVLAASRLGDWAMLRADTREIAPLPRAANSAVAIGGRLAAFDESGGAPTIGVLTVGGVSAVQGYGQRIRLSPELSVSAVGGPVIDEEGLVVAILGGSLTPGVRPDRSAVTLHPEWARTGADTATPINEVAYDGTGSKSLSQLLADGTLTPALVTMPELLYGATTAELPKDASNRAIRETTEFSSRDHKTIDVYSYWVKKTKLSKGKLSGTIFDPANKAVGSIAPKEVNLKGSEQRFSFSIPVKDLRPGRYRIEMYWDAMPVWRTYVRIID